jgi:chaperonin GroES
LLPESQTQKSSEGLVLSVGPGFRGQNGEIVPMSVLEGDKVLLPEYGGVQLKSEGDEIYLFRESEILAKIV